MALDSISDRSIGGARPDTGVELSGRDDDVLDADGEMPDAGNTVVLLLLLLLVVRLSGPNAGLLFSIDFDRTDDSGCTDCIDCKLLLWAANAL